MTKVFVIAVTSLLIASNTSFADSKGWKFTEGEKNANSEFNKRLPLPFKDDIASDQKINDIQLTPEQKHQALVWGLSDQEERRYVALMNNKSGHHYKNEKVSPVDVLGINARTNEERLHYAEKSAKQEFERLAKLFSFNAAYNQQAEKLKENLSLPIVRKFDYEPFSPYNYQPVDLRNDDQLMLFVNTNTHARSITSVLTAEMLKKNNIHLNIYFVGKGVSKEAIQEWAKQQNIPFSLAKSGQVTLNLDNHKFDRLKTDRKLPVLILVRGGNSHFVDLSRF